MAQLVFSKVQSVWRFVYPHKGFSDGEITNIMRHFGCYIEVIMSTFAVLTEGVEMTQSQIQSLKVIIRL